MTTPKATPIRKGDLVRIVTPSFFVRCGYPMDFKATNDEVLGEYRPKIVAFLRSIGFDPSTSDQERTIQEIGRSLAYATVRKGGFGGNERRIYTEDIPGLAGVVFLVDRVRFVKTGVRVPGSRDYSDEYDPPYLADEETHRILWGSPQDPLQHGGYRGIEAIHVERVVTP